MATVSYATLEQLAAWLPPDADSSLLNERLLVKASRVLDGAIRQPFALVTDEEDNDFGRPDDDDLRQVLADACCAQVEFWGLVGVEHHQEGLASQTVSIMSYNGPLPPDLAPEAFEVLNTAGLLTIPNGTLGRVLL